MKICIVARNLPKNYSGSFEFDQALALKSLGHDVHVLSLDLRSARRKRKLGTYSYEDKGIGITVVSVPLGAIPKKIFYRIGTLFFDKAFKNLIKEKGEFDIIHSHFLDNTYIVSKAKNVNFSKTKFVATEHSNVSRLSVYNKDEYIKNVVKDTYISPVKLIVVSKDLQTIIKKNYDADSIVVHNIVDTSIFECNRENKSDGNNSKTIISVGNLTKNKRMDMLIRCFTSAFDRNPSYKLIICGDGTEYDNLASLIKKLDNIENIKLLGKVDRREIAELYKNADLFVLLSEKETFGVAYVEAMAAGIPVLSSKSGGPEEFIIEEVGVMMDDDEDAIACKINEMIVSENYNSAFISKYARDNFAPEVIASELIKLYQEIQDV